MRKLAIKLNQKDGILIHPPSVSPYPLLQNSFSDSSTKDQSAPSSSSSSAASKISPIVILVIVVLAIIVFVCGLLHLLVRFLIKRPSFYSSVSHSNRYPDNSDSDVLRRQLHHLFRLHDSGLDQALIDALPVFFYKDVMGLKEPFDCAVCLCEFCDQDKLRLLPMCSHAFHINCIDTWLLSNSTCPLCRGALVASTIENQVLSLDYWREYSTGCMLDSDNNNGNVQNYKPTIMEEAVNERRVYSVRLGKYRSINNGVESRTKEQGETSSSNLDARRCHSLGSYQYVLGDSDLHVTSIVDGGSASLRLEKMKGLNGNSFVDGDLDGKKISRRSRGESFSVSKIWLWSNKRGKFPCPAQTNMGGGVHTSMGFPLDQAAVRGV